MCLTSVCILSCTSSCKTGSIQIVIITHSRIWLREVCCFSIIVHCLIIVNLYREEEIQIYVGRLFPYLKAPIKDMSEITRFAFSVHGSSIFFVGIAGGFAAAITTPLDCVKTVLNTQQSPQVDAGHRLLYQNARTNYRYFNSSQITN